MNLDALAGRAAADARSEAMSRAPHLDPAEYRETRRHRSNRIGALAAGTVTVVALTVLLVVSPKDDEPAAASTIPDVTSTTVVSAPTTTLPGEPFQPGTILGAGWEDLDFGPLFVGRYRMAVAWTGDELFVWGGTLHDTQEAPPPTEFLQDGYLYDPASDSWRAVGVPPDELCRLGETRAIWLDEAVLLHGVATREGDCAPAALFDPGTNTWRVLRGEFFDEIGTQSALAWTGELLVAPTHGIAFDVATGERIEIPRATGVADIGSSSPGRAYWTGEVVVTIGVGALKTWAPGDHAWASHPAPPVPIIARDSVWTELGLLVANYQMATAVWDSEQWKRIGDLPLRFYECYPEALVAAGTPVVRMCSGIAIWDDTRGTWIPVPNEDIGAYYWHGTLVGSDDALYSVGARFRRFRIERNEDGSIVLPPTIPIGVMQLDVPEGFEFVESFAPVQNSAGFIQEDETIGVVFGSVGGSICRVSSTYASPDAWLGELDGFTEIGPMAVSRPGRSRLEGTEFSSGSERSGALAFAFPDDNGSDVVLVACSGQPQVRLRGFASALAAGLWSPWETPTAISEPTLVVTPQAGGPGTQVTLRGSGFEDGWEELWLVVDDGGEPWARVAIEAMLVGTDSFTWGFHVDFVDGRGLVSLDPGTYSFVVDGRLIEGATFTKTIPPFPWVEIVDVLGTDNPVAPIGIVEIENRDIVSAELDGWRLVDEIAPTAELVIDNVTLEPGEQVVVRFVYGTCTPGVVGPTADPPTLQFCADEATVRYESIALRDGEGRLVDRAMVAPPDDPWVVFHDAERGVRFQVPVDHDLPVGPWQIADESLTPILGWEILSVGTYAMRAGGDRCAHVPQFALEDLGSYDAFVSIQRRSGPALPTAATNRPEEFTYEWLDQHGAGSEIPDCLSRSDAADLYIRWFSFIDRGALYYVVVAMGDGAFDTVRADQVLQILDSVVDER